MCIMGYIYLNKVSPWSRQVIGMIYCKSLIFRGYIYFAVFPMNVIFLEFNFTDFAFVTLLQCTAKMFVWYLTSRKQFICEIREINPTQNLRLLQYVHQICYSSWTSGGGCRMVVVMAALRGLCTNWNCSSRYHRKAGHQRVMAEAGHRCLTLWAGH